MKDYPWIKYEIDLRKVDYRTWMQLGECVSKCQHLRRIPLQPELRKRLHTVYLAKGVQATTAIEGNTLTEEQVRAIIEKRYKSPPSQRYLEQEVLNIVKACNQIGNRIRSNTFGPITVEMLCEFNRLVLEEVNTEEVVVPGELRKHNVGVGTYRGPEARDVRGLLGKFCEWMNGPDFGSEQLGPIAIHIIKAIVAHVYIAWIHPFGDGNGRTARLLEFAILLQSGVPSAAAHLLSNHYNITRTEYYRQLDRAGKSGDSLSGFLAYAIEGFRDGLEEQLEFIFAQVIDISWQHYVYELFRTIKNSQTNKRRRDLTIALSQADKPLAKSDLLVLMASDYRGKTDKTLSRDISELEKMGLIEKVGNQYRANKELVLEWRAFSAGAS